MNTLEIKHPFVLPADDWFHVAPLGEFDHASGVRQVIDDKACRAMADNFTKEAAAPNFPGLLVDFDHFSHSADKTSAAAGWVTALRAQDSASTERAPGLWAQVRWSDLGDAAVRGGRYRLVSPVWNRSDCESVGEEKVVENSDSAALPRVRPLRLERVALTNDPNLKGLVPLTNRTPEELLHNSQITTMNYKEQLLKLLGLKPEATDDEITAAISNRQEEQENFQQRYGALLAARVEDDLREFADVIGDVDSVRGQLLANRDDTLKVLRALHHPQPAADERPARRVATEPLHNRSAARVPEAVFSSEKNQADAARARRIANRAREIQKQLGVGHTQAFEMAKGEIAA